MSAQPNPQYTHTILNERVKQAFSLTDEDIEANREGQMSPRQAERLARPQEDQGGWGAGVLALALLFGCAVIAGKMNEVKGARGDIGSTVAIVLCSVAVMGLFGLGAWSSLKDDIRNKRVVAVEGVIECRSHSQKGEHYYRVSVGRASFAVPKHTYEAFTDGETYRLYYLPLSEVLIAAEHLMSAAPPPETVADSSNPLKPTSAHP